MITAKQMLIYALLLCLCTASVAAPTHEDDGDDLDENTKFVSNQVQNAPAENPPRRRRILNPRRRQNIQNTRESFVLQPPPRLLQENVIDGQVLREARRQHPWRPVETSDSESEDVRPSRRSIMRINSDTEETDHNITAGIENESVCSESVEEISNHGDPFDPPSDPEYENDITPIANVGENYDNDVGENYDNDENVTVPATNNNIIDLSGTAAQIEPIHTMIQTEIDIINSVMDDADLVFESLEALLENEEILLQNFTLLSSAMAAILVLLSKYPQSSCKINTFIKEKILRQWRSQMRLMISQNQVANESCSNTSQPSPALNTSSRSSSSITTQNPSLRSSTVTAFKPPSRYRSADISSDESSNRSKPISPPKETDSEEAVDESIDQPTLMGLQTTIEASQGATGGVLYAEDHPPSRSSSRIAPSNPARSAVSRSIQSAVSSSASDADPTIPHSNAWNAERRRGAIQLKKDLERAYKNQKEAFKKKKEKELDELKEKKDKLKEETWNLIKSKTGDTMKCPDCGEYKHRGGGMVTHRLNYCKKKQF